MPTNGPRQRAKAKALASAHTTDCPAFLTGYTAITYPHDEHQTAWARLSLGPAVLPVLVSASSTTEAAMTPSLLDHFAGFGIRDAAAHEDPDSAVERVTALYEQATARLADAFQRFTQQGVAPAAIDAFYPFLGLELGRERRSISTAGSPMARCTIPASTARR